MHRLFLITLLMTAFSMQGQAQDTSNPFATGIDRRMGNRVFGCTVVSVTATTRRVAEKLLDLI